MVHKPQCNACEKASQAPVASPPPAAPPWLTSRGHTPDGPSGGLKNRPGNSDLQGRGTAGNHASTTAAGAGSPDRDSKRQCPWRGTAISVRTTGTRAHRDNCKVVLSLQMPLTPMGGGHYSEVLWMTGSCTGANPGHGPSPVPTTVGSTHLLHSTAKGLDGASVPPSSLGLRTRVHHGLVRALRGIAQ